MGSSWMTQESPKSNDRSPYKREENAHREVRVETGAGIRESLKPPVAGVGQDEFSFGGSRRNRARLTP